MDAVVVLAEPAVTVAPDKAVPVELVTVPVIVPVVVLPCVMVALVVCPVFTVAVSLTEPELIV